VIGGGEGILGLGVELLRPWALGLAPAPLLAAWLAPALAPAAAPRPPAGVARWLGALGEAGGRKPAAPSGLALRVLGWVALVIALAGPVTRGEALTTPSGRDLILAVDLSASMSEEDMRLAGRRATRFAVLRDVVEPFLAGRTGDRVAVIGFATEAYLVAPPTHDVGAAAATLEELSIGLPGRRTDLGQAIGLAVRMLEDAPEGERLMLMLTDGEANLGELGAEDAAALAAGIGLELRMIGFGAEIAPENAAYMAAVAAITGGGYHEARDREGLAAVAGAIGAMAPLPGPETRERRVFDLSAPFLAAALCAAAAILWRERGGGA